MRPVAIIGPVKNLACLLLAVWLSLVAGFAQAHAAEQELRPLAHAAMSAGATAAHDTAHEEHCGMAHCGHILGLPMGAGKFTEAPEGSMHAASVTRPASYVLPDDIERPKWLAPVPAVASL